jgi:hypothetical protein
MPMYGPSRNAAANFNTNLHFMEAEAVITGSTAEVLVPGGKVWIAPGTFKATDILRVLLMGDKTNSGAPGTTTFHLHCGPLGSLADPTLDVGWAPNVNAANQSWGNVGNWRFETATLGRRIGSGNAGSGFTSESGQTTSGRPGTDTFPNIGTTGFYLTLGVQLAVAADAIRVTHFEVNRKRKV